MQDDVAVVMEKRLNPNIYSHVYQRMIFYDDERRNIDEVGEMGVSCVHCEDGLNVEKFMEGLEMFKKKNPTLLFRRR